jgi:hypothetical protein
VVHDQKAALRWCRTVRGYANAAENAGDPKRDFRQEAKPTANYGPAFEWEQPNRWPNDQALPKIEYRNCENNVDEEEDAAS